MRISTALQCIHAATTGTSTRSSHQLPWSFRHRSKPQLRILWDRPTKKRPLSPIASFRVVQQLMRAFRLTASALILSSFLFCPLPTPPSCAPLSYLCAAQPPADNVLGDAAIIHYTWGNDMKVRPPHWGESRCVEWHHSLRVWQCEEGELDGQMRTKSSPSSVVCAWPNHCATLFGHFSTHQTAPMDDPHAFSQSLLGFFNLPLLAASPLSASPFPSHPLLLPVPPTSRLLLTSPCALLPGLCWEGGVAL